MANRVVAMYTSIDFSVADNDLSPDFNMDEPTETDFPALIKDKTERWLAARLAVSAYLGTKKARGQSYDNLTADSMLVLLAL